MSERQLARGSRSWDFGVWERGGERLRAVWLERTGELWGLDLGGGRPARLLARLPASGHPDPERAAPIAEAALHGWTERSGLVGSRRSTGPSPARARAARARGEPVAESDEWGESCEACFGHRLVAHSGLSPARLEAALRAGRWRLAAKGTSCAGGGARESR